MTFVALDAVFLGVALLVALLARVRAGSRRPGEGAGRSGRAGWRPFALAALVMATLTTVFDNLMIAADLFDYGREHRLGILVGQAPVEDYAYPLAALVLLPALWRLLGARDDPGGDR